RRFLAELSLMGRKHSGHAIGRVVSGGAKIRIFGQVKWPKFLFVARVGAITGDRLQLENLEICGAVAVWNDMKLVEGVRQRHPIESFGKEVDSRRTEQLKTGTIHTALQ